MTPNAKPDRDFPYWLLLLIGGGLWLFYWVLADDLYAQVLGVLARGIGVTVMVTLGAYAGACVLGL